MSQRPLRLGVNIDHVATLRNARGSAYPDPVRAALVAQAAGADGIMVEVHPEPSAALCDGAQALTPSDFERLAVQLRALASVRDAADEVLR